MHFIWIPVLFGVYTFEFGTVSLLPFITNQFNLSTSIDGVSLALFALAVAIAGPIFGLIGSKIRDKNVVAALTFALAAANFMSAFATNQSSLMTARLVVLLVHPMLFPMLIGIAISSYPNRVKSLVPILGVIGALLGSAFSVTFVTHIAQRFSYSSCLITFAILDFMTGVALLSRSGRYGLC